MARETGLNQVCFSLVIGIINLIVSKETDSELQLIRLVREGDPMAMRTVYSTYVRYLTAIVSRYILNHNDIKDVLQESFLKIFSGITAFEYRGKGSLKGWLSKVTVNETLKFLRRNCNIKFVEISKNELDLPDTEPDIENLPSSIIFQMIRELPDGYRTIFNLYVIENKSHKEIASLLNIKESTSASQLHRAKSLLANKITQYLNSIPVSI